MAFYPADAARGLSSPWDPIILQAAAQYVVDPALIKAVITKESTWNPTAYRAEPQLNPPDASRGLMQILYRTAQGMGYRGTPDGLYDPTVNIDLGTRYLADQLNRFGYPLGVAAYNAGPGNVARGTIPTVTSQVYVPYVDAAYSWFIANDPIFAPGGGGATYFPRATAAEWRERRRLLAERGHAGG